MTVYGNCKKIGYYYHNYILILLKYTSFEDNYQVKNHRH